MAEKKMGVGFGVMILNKSGEVLLGQRNEDPKKADSLLQGEGTWTMPGGKLDFGEEFEEACVRETKEETGITLDTNQLKLISLTNDIVPKAHFVTIGFLYEGCEDEPKVLEPDEIVKWKWFKLSNLPKKVFLPSQKVLENYKKKSIY